ncbi:MAG: pectate lyase [Cyclobacteriaceae bacterium]|nr:pectate lyase [Cyclobacteriaceae bacterium]
MMRQIISIVLILLSSTGCAQKVVPVSERTSIPLAFPGAEGFGKYTSGGREGKVYVVTNLNDSGPGSLREAVKKKEKRIITFAVSGTIALESDLNISYGDLTIAGQSAPGDGICIRNYPVKVGASNVIIRYLRFRLGDERKVQEDAFSGVRQKNVIIDHCSMSWATDECASFYYNENFTMQWCIISESLNNSVHEKGEHGYGGIWGGVKASFHHNLLANHSSRLPRFSGSSTTPNTPDELVDFRNNVIYNWRSNNTYGGEGGRYNIVSNYYKPGPSTGNSKKWIVNPSSPVGKFYIADNLLDGDEKISKNNWSGVKTNSIDSTLSAKPFATEAMEEESASSAFESVVKNAGASFKRDKVDARIADEVRKGNSSSGKKSNGIIDSQSEVGGWPELVSLPAPQDADGDGIPDEWEIKNRLDPKNVADGSTYSLSKGFTNIEVYLNSLLKK